MLHASPDFRIVLRDRAARKVKAKQLEAARQVASLNAATSKQAGVKRSAEKKQQQQQQSSPSSPSIEDHRLLLSSSFDEFRYRFYLRHREAIEAAFPRRAHSWIQWTYPPPLLVEHLCFAPVPAAAQRAFMAQLAALRTSSEVRAELVYHGLTVGDLSDVCSRSLQPSAGLRGKPTIECSLSAVHEVRGARDTRTILVCAGLTTSGDGETARDARGLSFRKASRLAPLFLLHFAPLPSVGCLRTPTNKLEQGPWIPRRLMHRMLARMRTVARRHDARTSLPPESSSYKDVIVPRVRASWEGCNIPDCACGGELWWPAVSKQLDHEHLDHSTAHL